METVTKPAKRVSDIPHADAVGRPYGMGAMRARRAENLGEKKPGQWPGSNVILYGLSVIHVHFMQSFIVLSEVFATHTLVNCFQFFYAVICSFVAFRIAQQVHQFIGLFAQCFPLPQFR